MLLIIGASGYVGRQLHSTVGRSQAFATHRSKPVPGSVYFDATETRIRDILPEHHDISHAIILYAEADIDRCKADLKRSQAINVASAKQLISDLMDIEIKPVFTSSEYVFDGERGGYTEGDPATPNTVYGQQKLEIEYFLAQNGDDYTVLRLAKVFGTEANDGTILFNWLKQISNGEEIRCATDQVFSPIHLNDVVAAIQAVVELDLNGVYQVSNREPWSRLGMLTELIDSLGIDANVMECSIRDFGFLQPRPFNLSMSPDKILKATGLDFRSVQDCCQELANGMRQSGSEAGTPRRIFPTLKIPWQRRATAVPQIRAPSKYRFLP